MDFLTELEGCVASLRRYARALLRDADGADDLVQDCLERALNRWLLRRPSGNLRSWLFAILHNGFVSGRRQAARRGIHTGLDERAFELEQPAVQESTVVMGDLLAALDTLPDEQRAVLLLVGVEDLTYDEAARVLDVPIGTVMSRLSRGRERLRRVMNGERPAVAPVLRRVK